MESESPLDVDRKFIEENKKIKFKNSKKGGPYSKGEKEKRRQEVYKLHFDYGYSARRISEMMKINRNTINGDIAYWYIRIFKTYNKPMNPEIAVMLNIERLDIQRSRLREQVDKAKSVQERMSIERLICEIDSKILHTHNRLSESERRLLDESTKRLNEFLKENRSKTQYLTLSDKISVSNKTAEKIHKLIEEDKISPPRQI